MTISKRINARLQLAAALIEADNEALAEKAALEEERARHAREIQASGADPTEATSAYTPASLPEAKLASESAIFAPYRRGDQALPHSRSRSNSLASRLSLLDANGAATDERLDKPSVDFLGVALPSEKRKSYARSNSIGSLSRHSMESRQAFGPAQQRDWEAPSSTMSHPARNAGPKALETDLDGWGVDKFLSIEERRRLEGKRSRANSSLGTRPGTPSGNSVASTTHSRPGDVRGRAQSETMTASTGLDDLAQLRRRTTKRAGEASADPLLLAKIRLYRARQETLPPSEWQGPGPLASGDALTSHFIRDEPSLAEGVDVGHGLDVKILEAETRALDAIAKPHLGRRQSSAAQLGESWSEEDLTINNGLEQSTPRAATQGRVLQPADSVINVGSPPLQAPRRYNASTKPGVSQPLSRASMLLDPSFDPFGDDRDATTRYPGANNGPSFTHEDPAMATMPEDGEDDDTALGALRQSLPMDGLTTRQLQRLAKRNRMPEFYGELPPDARSSIDTRRSDVSFVDAFGPISPKKSTPARLQKRTPGAAPTVADLTSSKWKGKLWFGKQASSSKSESKEAAGRLETPLEEEQDDWRLSGPLQARGLESRQPRTLVMPSPLQDSPFAPDSTPLTMKVEPRSAEPSSQYVPPGFVLHDGRGLPPMRLLPVHAAASEPLMNPDAKVTKKADTLIRNFLQSTLAERALPVAPTAPAALGRRAASGTTALFRNQLVQKDDEREGWGWEESSRAAQAVDSEVESTEISKAKKARRGLKQRVAEYQYASVKGEDGTQSSEYETDSDTGASASTDSDNRERWIDDQKPAGTLYGRSLMDVAQQRLAQKASAKT